MGTFNLPASFKARPRQVDPGLRRGKKIEAFKIHHSNPQNGRNPLPGYLSIDLFSEELHAGSVYTEREIMIIGEECERVLELLVGNYGLDEVGCERGRADTFWCHLKWMRRERDRLIASKITNSLADATKGDKKFEVSLKPVLKSLYWTDDYGWFLQRIRNLFDLTKASSSCWARAEGWASLTTNRAGLGYAACLMPQTSCQASKARARSAR
jgi:hypothetical protein